MIFSFIRSTFGWMPFTLQLLVSAIFSIFIIFVAISLLKAIARLIEFLVNILGGVFGKVVALFV